MSSRAGDDRVAAQVNHASWSITARRRGNIAVEIMTKANAEDTRFSRPPSHSPRSYSSRLTTRRKISPVMKSVPAVSSSWATVSPAKTVPEFVNTRRRAGALNYASSGTGTARNRRVLYSQRTEYRQCRALTGTAPSLVDMMPAARSSLCAC